MRIDGELLDSLYRQGALEAIDVHFGRCIAGLDPEAGPALGLAAALTSHWTRLGHVCTELAALAGQPLLDTERAPRAPGLDAWLAALRRSPAVGAPGERRPLVLDGGGRLYLYRYWQYEQEVAQSLLERVSDNGTQPEPEAIRTALDAIYPPAGAADEQRVAGALAASRRLCVVSGGPGTGKTTAVLALLKLLYALHGNERRPRIALAAPTGKAAARMQEAVSQSGGADARLVQEATTLHRLLGFRPDSPRPRHDRDTPLALEALIVDEASMIDIALMAKLLRALPRRARLIVVGDKHQLGPVEAGAVLADLCQGAGGYSPDYAQYLGRCTGLTLPAATGARSAFADSIVHLKQGFRYTAGGGLSRLAQAILRGDPDEALALCRSGLPGLRWHETPDSREASGLTAAITEGYREYCESLQSGAAPVAVLAALRHFRILCAHRAGPYGAEAWHRRAERVLTEAGVLDARSAWYAGRPLIIERNDYATRLFNGDTGVLLPDPAQDGTLRAYFEGADGTLRGLAPGRLPAHSGLFAITVHKSQGSEHERVLLVLPPWDTPLLTRELLYTAVTRARSEVEIWGRESVLRAAIGRSLRRSSGLADALAR
ncbi:MAG: exodeoxyribonuclease V subunit alpha [Gammaproteobacteria bacterium]